MVRAKSLLAIFCLLVVGLISFELYRKSKSNLDVVEFWDYWNGKEAIPVKKLIDQFNDEDHGFKIKRLGISMPRQKILMAIVSNQTPDLVHIDGEMATDFALRNGLMPLDELITKHKFPIKDYVPIYLEMLRVDAGQGEQQWALPWTPSAEALHINTHLLNKHGLKPPETLDDIVTIFDKATDFKDFKELGWMPSWPPWLGKIIVYFFGGQWATKIDGQWQVTANDPNNVEAWTWVQENFAKKLPKDKLALFTQGFGAYQSLDNPFYAEKIVIEHGGVWERQIAHIFNPKLKMQITKIPGRQAKTTFLAMDALGIPRAAKHPDKAMYFLKWLLTQKNNETLSTAQGKFTGLKNHSPEFFVNHPNPFIKVFVDLGLSKNAHYFPQIKDSQKYKREIRKAYARMLRLEMSPKEALDQLQNVMGQ